MGATVLAMPVAGRTQHRVAQGRHFDAAGGIAQHIQLDRDPCGIDPPGGVEFNEAAKDEAFDVDIRALRKL